MHVKILDTFLYVWGCSRIHSLAAEVSVAHVDHHSAQVAYVRQVTIFLQCFDTVGRVFW